MAKRLASGKTTEDKAQDRLSEKERYEAKKAIL
jgi:hypothetical protein